MHTRKLGPFDSSAIGFGGMCLSHAYGVPPDEETATAVLLKALDLGYNHIDSAALYGFGANETLIGNVLRTRRQEFILVTKGGIFRNEQGQRVIDSRAEKIKQNCEESLGRLRTDVIDLYYLHRWDKRVPIEESIGALADLVREGKVKTIGLSEVSAATLRKAHAVHPIAALQTEYSLWTRNAEVAVLETCRELGIAFVAFSPVARGFFGDEPIDPATFPPKDIRLGMPRFQREHFAKNLPLRDGLSAVARESGCTMAQTAIAWVLAQGPHVIPIPGTTRLDHLEENARAESVRLSPAALAKLNELINPSTVSGARYNPAVQQEIDTEELDPESPKWKGQSEKVSRKV